MTLRRNGKWLTLQAPIPFHTPHFTVDWCKKIAYTMRQRKASRERIEEALRKYEVEDPDTQWGVGEDTIQRILEEVCPTPKEEQTLW
jgi:hypothetical protein